MPGRHGKQRVVRKKSRGKKPRNSPMEQMVTDSYFQRNRKEQSILADLVPMQRLEVKRVAEGSLGANAKSAPIAPPASAAANVPAKHKHWTKPERKPKEKKHAEQQEAATGAATASLPKNALAAAKKVQQQQKTSARSEAERLLESLAGGR